MALRSLLHKSKLEDFSEFMHNEGFILTPFAKIGEAARFVDIRNNRGRVYVYDDGGAEHFSVPDGLSSQMVLKYIEEARNGKK